MAPLIGLRRRRAGSGRRAWAPFLGLLAVLAAGLVFASPALGWSQVYRSNDWVPPGGIAYSGNNYGLHWNETVFESYYDNLMQLTLCNTQPACYEYRNSPVSFWDDRSISYGHAKCTAYQYNWASLFVYHCFTHNQ
jgi:hypothetical protein